MLIPKVGGDFCGIRLVEVMWKTPAMVRNLRLGAAITFHNVLHGFLSGCGMGNASLDAKLIQQLISIREEGLYTIFLGLHKACGALYKDRFLGILEVYILVPQIFRLLHTYWVCLTMVDRVCGYHGAPFKRYQGVT